MALTASAPTTAMAHLALLTSAFDRYAERPAFCMAGVVHTYAELGQAVASIRALIRAQVAPEERLLGVTANDDLLTYAALIALWSEGRAYLPLDPASPRERNELIASRAGIATVLSSGGEKEPRGIRVLPTTTTAPSGTLPAPPEPGQDQLAYVLFTSGSTGEPKGVPITHGNLAAFLRGFDGLQVPFNEQDRCLQMFELTFDLSVMSYLVPLLRGACVYTVPKDGIKYGYIAELLEDKGITVALMVPSIIHYLRPYFDEINAPSLHTNLFCGEALPMDVTREWSRCVPNARIINVYGPTEHTIFCTQYVFDAHADNKAVNGVLSIGRALEGTELIIVDDQRRILPPGEKGELCLGGQQMTPGYWQDEAKTASAIFQLERNGRSERFYRTGDLCTMDADGDVLYLGRLDHQVKIQGYRVELAEIEHHARSFLQRRNAVALSVGNAIGNNEVALAIEGQEQDTRELLSYLREHLPAYMVPTRLRFVEQFPLNTNGKTDRKNLQTLFTS